MILYTQEDGKIRLQIKKSVEYKINFHCDSTSLGYNDLYALNWQKTRATQVRGFDESGRPLYRRRAGHRQRTFFKTMNFFDSVFLLFQWLCAMWVRLLTAYFIFKKIRASTEQVQTKIIELRPLSSRIMNIESHLAYWQHKHNISIRSLITEFCK